MHSSAHQHGQPAAPCIPVNSLRYDEQYFAPAQASIDAVLRLRVTLVDVQEQTPISRRRRFDQRVARVDVGSSIT